MKKKSIFLEIIILMLIFVLTGCGSSKDNENKDNQSSKLSLNVGEAKSINDTLEITIKSNKILSKIEPSSASGYYTYYEAGEGNKFLDIVADVKNISSEAIKLGEVCEAKLHIDDKEYDVLYMAEENDGQRLNTYANSKSIDPLTTVTYHMATKLNKDLLAQDTTAKLVLTIDEKEYSYIVNIVRSDEDTSSSKSTINLNDKGTEISKDQLVTVKDNCEFTINSCDFKSKILPTTPSGYYHYIDAKDGKVYLDIKATVKNLKNSEVKQDVMLGNITLVYNDNYEYSCSKVIEEDNGQDLNTYTNLYNIDPLATMTYHIICEVPVEVQNSSYSLYVKFAINGEDYVLNIR